MILMQEPPTKLAFPCGDPHCLRKDEKCVVLIDCC